MRLSPCQVVQPYEDAGRNAERCRAIGKGIRPDLKSDEPGSKPAGTGDIGQRSTRRCCVVPQSEHSKVCVSKDGRAGLGFDLTSAISFAQLVQIGGPSGGRGFMGRNRR